MEKAVCNYNFQHSNNKHICKNYDTDRETRLYDLKIKTNRKKVRAHSFWTEVTWNWLRCIEFSLASESEKERGRKRERERKSEKNHNNRIVLLKLIEHNFSFLFIVACIFFFGRMYSYIHVLYEWISSTYYTLYVHVVATRSSHVE